jgi:hypothetical protein
MNEVYTIEEMESRFDGEWVLIADPELAPGPRLLGGKVVFHGADRDDLDSKMRELQLKSSASLFMGGPPEGLEYAISVWTI